MNANTPTYEQELRQACPHLEWKWTAYGFTKKVDEDMWEATFQGKKICAIRKMKDFSRRNEIGHMVRESRVTWEIFEGERYESVSTGGEAPTAAEAWDGFVKAISEYARGFNKLAKSLRSLGK